MRKRKTVCVTSTAACGAKAVYRQISTLLLCLLAFFILLFSMTPFGDVWPIYRVEHMDGTIEYERMVIANLLSFSEWEGIAIWGRYDSHINEKLVKEFYDEEEGILYTFDRMKFDDDYSNITMFLIVFCLLILLCNTWSQTILPEPEHFQPRYGRRVRLQRGRRLHTDDRYD